MDVFDLRDTVVREFRSFVESFVDIRDERIRSRVQEALSEGTLWPEPWLSLNPMFEYGGSIDELVASGLLHSTEVSEKA
ncbi:hypothetical protein [Acidimicrobium ferrooxidans]|uniref:hypothetical protein n=1 Tax=Acidimicrobium ferrooxidans TaxID=53635 RepID=UPI000302E3A3|nr:hypothetical protein [Acidimicrobium ferrooxidans]